MFGWIPIIGKTIDKIFGIIDEAVEDKDKRNQIKFQIEMTMMQLQAKMLEVQRDIIVAEAKGESWLQRSWRPITMLVFVYIIAHNYVISPLFGLKTLPMPPQIWGVIKLGLGGYVIGRSAEKITREIKSPLKKLTDKGKTPFSGEDIF